METENVNQLNHLTFTKYFKYTHDLIWFERKQKIYKNFFFCNLVQKHILKYDLCRNITYILTTLNYQCDSLTDKYYSDKYEKTKHNNNNNNNKPKPCLVQFNYNATEVYHSLWKLALAMISSESSSELWPSSDRCHIRINVIIYHWMPFQ